MRAAALILMLAAGCGADSVLVVQVRTDLAPGVDFDRIETRVGERLVLTRASDARAWGRGVRVAELRLPEGRHRATVGAYRGDTLVVARSLSVEVSGATVSTVLLTRSCVGVVCPGVGDGAELTACVAGRCRADGCSEESADACDPPGCAGCPAATGCAVGECTASAGCFVTLDHASCPGDQLCDADGSCAPSSMCPAVQGSLVSLTAGWLSTCVNAIDQPLRCFGRNSYRHALELGDTIRTPTAVHPDERFSTAQLGDSFACGLLIDGRLACWGETSSGMLGDGTEAPGGSTELVFPGVPPPTRLWVGGYGFCVDTGTETLCAGQNDRGQLGVATSVNEPVPIAHPGRYRDIGLGQHHGCGVRTDGSLWCWGDNVSGGVAQPTAGTFLEPVRVGTDDDWQQVDVGSTVTAATRTDGSVWTWGQREHVGRAFVMDASVPAPLEYDAGGVQPAALAMGHDHGCVLYADGRLVCWGADWCEQAGNPEAMTDAPTPYEPMPGRRFAYVAAGQCHTCAIDEAPQLVCWGANAYGQLGDPAIGLDAALSTPREICVPR